MYTGPNIKKRGLVFGFDTGYGVNNTAIATRNYKGRPTTNLAEEPVPAFSNWSNMSGTSEYYTTSEGRRGIHLVTQNGGGVKFYDIPTITNISSSTQYTISAKVKYTGSGTSPHPNLFYVRQYHNGSQITESGKFSTSFLIDLGDGWYRAYRTFTTESTTSYINLQGYQYYDDMNIKIEDIQFELGNQTTPFAGISGTRSATNSLVDLKKTTNIDLSNVSFDTLGQPDFDGTDDFFTTSGLSTNESATLTFETVIRFNGALDSNDRKIFHWDKTGTSNGVAQIRKGTNNGRLMYQHHNGSQWYTLSVDDVVVADTFAHIVVVHNGTTAIMYKNGTQIGTTSVGLLNYTDAGEILLGYRSSAEYWKGDIPVFKMYTNALSASEIKQNFNAYKNRFNI